MVFIILNIGDELKKMEKNNSVFRNFIMNIILTMSSFIFPLITFPYVSRILLPVGTGKVSFSTSVVNYFLLIAQLGIPTYGIRACAKVRDDKEKLNKTVQEILLISIIMCIISYVLFFSSILFIPKFAEERKLLIVTSTMILFTTIGVEWVFKALEMYSYITWRSIIFKVIALVAMFILVKKQEDYVIYGAISIFASSASNVLNFIYLHKLVDLKVHFKLDIHKHMKPILVFFAMSCATTIYLNLDTIMLGFMKTDADVGYYNAAVKIKNMLVSIVTSLGTVLLPRVTYYLEKGEKEKFKNLAIKAIQFVMFISLPMLVYFIVFARQGVLLLSGNEYENAILPMQIMMPTLFFIGLTNIMGIQILVPQGREDKVLISVIAGAIVDLILNAILIPKYAAAGAAFGTMVAEVVVFIVQYFIDKELFRTLFHYTNPFKFILATGIGVFASVWFLKMDFNYFICLVLGAICFGGAYLVSLILLKESFLKEIQKIVKGKNKV